MLARAFLLLFAAVFTTASPAAPEISGNVPASPQKAESSGCVQYDKILKQAKNKRRPIVIEITGTSWCVHCREFTKKYVDTPAFKRANGKDFIFWTVDTKQIPGRTPGSFTFGFIPEDAAQVVGCLGSKAPYTVFGPPAIIVVDPMSGKMLAEFTGRSELEKSGKTLDEYVASLWKEHLKEAKRMKQSSGR